MNNNFQSLIILIRSQTNTYIPKAIKNQLAPYTVAFTDNRDDIVFVSIAWFNIT